MSRELESMHPELRRRVFQVARLCRRKLWMGRLKQFGWALFGLTCGFTFLLFVLSPQGDTGTALFLAYVLSIVCAAGYTVYCVRREPITLKQVALYIDEHHPELENRIASALDLSTETHPGTSAWLVERFLEETLPIVRNTSLADVLNRRAAVGLAISAGSILLSAGIVIFLFSHLWLPSMRFMLPAGIADVVALPFSVEPGDARVRVGDNLMVWVRTEENDRALKVRWRAAGGGWRESSLERTDSDTVYYHQFINIRTDME